MGITLCISVLINTRPIDTIHMMPILCKKLFSYKIASGHWSRHTSPAVPAADSKLLCSCLWCCCPGYMFPYHWKKGSIVVIVDKGFTLSLCKWISFRCIWKFAGLFENWTIEQFLVFVTPLICLKYGIMVS